MALLTVRRSVRNLIASIPVSGLVLPLAFMNILLIHALGE